MARRLVPQAVRRALGAERARMRASRFERDLGALVAGGHTIVAGPWLGEVGFELLYWVPFLARIAERFNLSERMVAVSRGGTFSWYRPAVGGYREIFDQLTPDEFRRRHDERVAINGEQKQNQVLAFEHDLLGRLAGDIRPRAMLHPASMYRLLAPYWWGHVGEEWVHRFCRYRVLAAPGIRADGLVPAEPYTAVKFYFNDCFPPTEANRTFVARLLEQLAARGPVVSLTTGLRLDDHGGCDVEALGVRLLPPAIDPRENLALQTQIVAGARAFVGTYGGFAYLAPFHGVPAVGFYDRPDGFSKRHLEMAHSALGRAGGGRLAAHAARAPEAAAALVEALDA